MDGCAGPRPDAMHPWIGIALFAIINGYFGMVKLKRHAYAGIEHVRYEIMTMLDLTRLWLTMF